VRLVVQVVAVVTYKAEDPALLIKDIAAVLVAVAILMVVAAVEVLAQLVVVAMVVLVVLAFLLL
jgi:hypothetical protein